MGVELFPMSEEALLRSVARDQGLVEEVATSQDAPNRLHQRTPHSSAQHQSTSSNRLLYARRRVARQIHRPRGPQDVHSHQTRIPRPRSSRQLPSITGRPREIRRHPHLVPRYDPSRLVDELEQPTLTPDDRIFLRTRLQEEMAGEYLQFPEERPWGLTQPEWDERLQEQEDIYTRIAERRAANAERIRRLEERRLNFYRMRAGIQPDDYNDPQPPPQGPSYPGLESMRSSERILREWNNSHTAEHLRALALERELEEEINLEMEEEREFESDRDGFSIPNMAERRLQLENQLSIPRHSRPQTPRYPTGLESPRSQSSSPQLSSSQHPTSPNFPHQPPLQPTPQFPIAPLSSLLPPIPGPPAAITLYPNDNPYPSIPPEPRQASPPPIQFPNTPLTPQQDYLQNHYHSLVQHYTPSLLHFALSTYNPPTQHQYTYAHLPTPNSLRNIGAHFRTRTHARHVQGVSILLLFMRAWISVNPGVERPRIDYRVEFTEFRNLLMREEMSFERGIWREVMEVHFGWAVLGTGEDNVDVNGSVNVDANVEEASRRMIAVNLNFEDHGARVRMEGEVEYEADEESMVDDSVEAFA